MRIFIQGVAVLAASTMLLSADTLYLKDGRILQGTFLGGDNRGVRFLPDEGASQRYAIASVKNIVFGDDAEASANTSSNNNDAVFGNRTTSPTVSGARGDGYGSDSNRPYNSGDRSRNGSRMAPSGTVVTVRTIDPINSDTTNVGETFRGSLDDPIVANGETLVPKGADVVMKVTKVQQSGRITGNEEVALVLFQILANGRTYEVNSNIAEVASKSRGEQSAKVIGGTAVVGAIIGAIAGGGKGAAIGAAAGAGAGAAVQAIHGQRVQIPSESKLDFTLAQPLYID